MIKTYLTLAMICFLLGCSSAKKTPTIEPEPTPAPEPPPATTEVRSLWTDADARLVAKEMITDCLSWAWVRAHKGSKGGKPVVTVALILDKTGGEVDCRTLRANLERELSRSDQVSFVAYQSQLPQKREEGGNRRGYPSRAAVNQIKAETGANFILTGTVSQTTEEVEDQKITNYQTDLEMINADTMAKVWTGTRKVWKPGSKTEAKP